MVFRLQPYVYQNSIWSGVTRLEKTAGELRSRESPIFSPETARVVAYQVTSARVAESDLVDFYAKS